MNVFCLREQIHARLPHLFTYPLADPEFPENIYETLAHPDLFPAAFAAMDTIPMTDDHPSLPSYSPLERQQQPVLRRESA